MNIYIGDPATGDLTSLGEVKEVRITFASIDAYRFVLAMAVAYAWGYQS